MSITQNPVTGRMSGSFANATFQTQYGKNIMRSKPLTVHNPQSPGQMSQRARMNQAGKIVKAISLFINTVFQASYLKMPVASWLVKHSLTNAITAVGEVVTVDWGNIMPAPDALGIASEFTLTKSVADQVSVSWSNATLSPKVTAEATLSFLLLDVATETFYQSIDTFTSAEEVVVFAVPGTNTAKTFKLWVYPKKVVRFKAGAELSGAV